MKVNPKIWASQTNTQFPPGLLREGMVECQHLHSTSPATAPTCAPAG